jgi:hypothetical protein
MVVGTFALEEVLRAEVATRMRCRSESAKGRDKATVDSKEPRRVRFLDSRTIFAAGSIFLEFWCKGIA